MAPVEFTFDWYRSFLRDLIDAGYRFRSYDEALDPGSVVLRHDVDLSPERSLQVARLEADLDVTSTFFFLLSSPMYNPLDAPTREAIRSIEALGHDVGLHFSTHQYWPASDPPAESSLGDRVDEEHRILSALVDRPIGTISFHIPPEWVLRRRFPTFESTYEPRFFDEIGYVADSNQRWRESHPLADGLADRVQVLTHPGLWEPSDGRFDERVEAARNATRERVRAYTTDRFLEPGPPAELARLLRESETEQDRIRKQIYNRA